LWRAQFVRAVKFLKNSIDCRLDQGENQTTRKARLVHAVGRPFCAKHMNPVLSPLTRTHSPRQADAAPSRAAISQESVLDDLVHELRQPLSVIESLAYFLEMTSKDEKFSPHLQQIQAMVRQASRILNQARDHSLSSC